MSALACPKKKARVAANNLSSASSQSAGQSLLASGTSATPGAEVKIIKEHRTLDEIKNLKLGKNDCSIMGRVIYVSLPHMMKSGIQYAGVWLIRLIGINVFHATSAHIMCGDYLENEAWMMSLWIYGKSFCYILLPSWWVKQDTGAERTISFLYMTVAQRLQKRWPISWCRTLNVSSPTGFSSNREEYIQRYFLSALEKVINICVRMPIALELVFQFMCCVCVYQTIFWIYKNKWVQAC